MAKQDVKLGVEPNGTGGDTNRSAFLKVNGNFTELYRAMGAIWDEQISGEEGAVLPEYLPVVKGGLGNGIGRAVSADKLHTARKIGIGGGVTGTATSFNGTADITIDVTSIDASKIKTGTIPAARIPTLNQNTTGNAATADNALHAVEADHATTADLATNATEAAHAVAADSSYSLSSNYKINGIVFNATQDITIADATKLPLSGGTLTGNLTAPKFIGALQGTADIANTLNFTPITTGEDLNNIVNLGWYRCNSNTIAASLSNCPVNTAFGLEVLANNAVSQRLTSNDTTNQKMFQRVRTAGGVWSAWSEILTSNNVGATAGSIAEFRSVDGVAGYGYGGKAKAITGGTDLQNFGFVNGWYSLAGTFPGAPVTSSLTAVMLVTVRGYAAGSALIFQLWNNSVADYYIGQATWTEVTESDGRKTYKPNSTITWRKVWTAGNTTVDSNGFVKSASPIVALYADRIELNDEAQQQPITFEKVATGHYLIKGSTGFSQEGWYIEQPKDANGNIYHAVMYKTLENGDIEIKTFEQKLDGVRIVADTEHPVDIKENRFITVRLQSLPEESEDEN